MLLEKRIQYINRYREIGLAFSKSGFGYILEELGLDEVFSLPKRLLLRQQASKITEKSRGARIRHLLEDLGPTFVKLGQIASTRPDVIAPDIIKELEKLQADVQHLPFETVQEIIEESLGAKIDDLFTHLDPVPIGSASIGQVHRGTLKNGQEVAIKVQRPHIEKVIRNDLEILNHLATIADQRMELAKQYQIAQMIEEFSREIVNELDYTIEARNQDKVRKQFETADVVKVPEIIWELTTKKVLTMEYIGGVNINEYDKLLQEGYDTRHIAEVLTQAIFHQILIEGFFHGDPHPGNIKILPDETVCFIDFGMIGRLTQEMKGHFGLLIISLMRKDADGVVRAITKMGAVPDTVNMSELRRDAEMLRDKYYDVPLSQMSLGQAVQDMFHIANKHKIILPSDFTILGKTILTLEIVVKRLDPDFSIIDVAEPFGRELIKERLQPDYLKSQAIRNWHHISDDIEDITTNVHEFTKGLKERRLPISVELDTADKMLRRLDKLGNRLSFSIILLSFSIILVGLLVSSALSGQVTILWNIPIIEIGTVIAIILFVGMFLAILKSGRL